jgi:hypothetical protein
VNIATAYGKASAGSKRTDAIGECDESLKVGHHANVIIEFPCVIAQQVSQVRVRVNLGVSHNTHDSALEWRGVAHLM